MTNQTKYDAMREALEHTDNWIRKMCLEMKAHNFFPHMAELGLKYSKAANEALTLPEPDPAQELLASVQLERVKANLSKVLFAGAPVDVNWTDEIERRYPTPNKADAEALVRVLSLVLAFRKEVTDLANEGYQVESGDSPSLQELISWVDEAATPLIKQIAGGG